LLLLVHVFITVLGNQWYVPSGVWKRLYQRTHGLLHPTLMFGLIYLLVVICGVLLGLGRRRPEEIGIEWRKLPVGALYAGLLWFSLQIVLAAWYLALGEPLAIANGWDGIGILGKAGELLGQLFGNALCEEIVFRGFLLVQLVLLLSRQWPDQPRCAFIVAFLLTAAIFAVQHLPLNLRQDHYVSTSKLAGDQLALFLGGCIYGWLYWQTRNLFFVVGAHALCNVPTTLWAARGPLWNVEPWVRLLAIAIALFWRRPTLFCRRAA
jgi:membrane protease YdiL (CAAX protease family)